MIDRRTQAAICQRYLVKIFQLYFLSFEIAIRESKVNVLEDDILLACRIISTKVLAFYISRCYYPDGILSQDVLCNSSSRFSTCCDPTWTCLPNEVCQEDKPVIGKEAKEAGGVAPMRHGKQLTVFYNA